MSLLLNRSQRVDSKFVVQLLKDKNHTNNDLFYILDARDDDRMGGHIRGSIHIADSMDHSEKVALIHSIFKEIETYVCTMSQTKSNCINDNKVNNIWIITHCMESICRGPRLAQLIESLLLEKYSNNDKKNNNNNSKNILDLVKVRVLHGGLDHWIRKYYKDATLVEQFNDDYWGFYEVFLIKRIQLLIDSIDQVNKI